MTIFTVGHSTQSQDEFFALLEAWRIEALVDIRSFPGSRKFPQFNREALLHALSTRGVHYLHLKGLGGLRKKIDGESPNKGWQNESFRNYADYMQTEDFREALDQLLQLAGNKRTAVMCAEAVPWRCHRQLLADALVALRKTLVLHIMGADKVQEHRLTSFAKVDGTLLTYPPGKTL